MIQQKQTLFMEAYEPCHDAFVRYCSALAYGYMDVEDLFQEAILSAYKNFENIEDKENLLYYLIRTAKNITISKRRRSKAQVESLDYHREQLISRGLSPEISIDVDILYQKMNRLPSKQRDALILFEIIGFSIKEIAEIQETSVGAIKTMLSRARKKLRLLMEEKSTSRKKTALIWPLAINERHGPPAFKEEQLFENIRQLPPPLDKEQVMQMIMELPYTPVSKTNWITQITQNNFIMNAITMAIISSAIIYQTTIRNEAPTIDSELSALPQTSTLEEKSNEDLSHLQDISIPNQIQQENDPSEQQFPLNSIKESDQDEEISINLKRDDAILKDLFSLNPSVPKPLKTTMGSTVQLLDDLISLGNKDPSQKEERPIGPFHSLVTNGLAVVYLSSGEKNTVSVEVSGMPIKDLITKEKDGVLTITTRGNHNGEKISVHISSPSLKYIEVGGASELYSNDPIKAENLEIAVTDAGAAWLEVEVGLVDIRMEGGDLSITGKAVEQKIDYWSHPDALRGTLKNRGLQVSKKN